MVARDLVASGFERRVTRRIPLVEQKLLTLPEKLSSTFFVAFLFLNINFLCSFCRSAFVFFSYFFWTLYCLLFFDWFTSLYFQTFLIWHVELFTIITFSDAAFVNVHINFRNIGHNKISFVSNKTFENLLQLTSL